MVNSETVKPQEYAIPLHGDAIPDFGEPILEREIPSDPALVTPAVVRTLEALKEGSLLTQERAERLGLCLEEALTNAVVHGNRGDFNKKVSLRAYRVAAGLAVVVSDEGAGFDPGTLWDPTGPERVWEESGRGLFLVWTYMHDVSLYDQGRSIVMVWRGEP